MRQSLVNICLAENNFKREMLFLGGVNDRQ